MGNITEEQKIFFDSIKDACINAGNKANILPSIIGGIAALISNYGNSEFYRDTNNLFSMTVDDSWFGTCYSVDSKITYENPKSCDEKNFILLKAFTSADECIFLLLLEDLKMVLLSILISLEILTIRT